MDVDGDLYWSPGKWVADQTQNDYRSLRPGAKNHWVYGRAAFSFLKKISHSLLFNFKLRGQLASTNLIATEQLGIGGYDTVRGYEEREVNTDNGIIANAELRISPPFHLLKRKQTHDVLQCVAFLDYGYGKNHQTIPGGPNHQWLLGMGPGLRYTIEPYLTARIDWGIKLHHSLQFTNQKNFIYFSVIGSY
jgi:hemolysin activation/secretion protein